MHPAAGVEVGQRRRRVALAEQPAYLPVGGVLLADHGGQLGVPTHGLVDLGVPAGRAACRSRCMRWVSTMHASSTITTIRASARSRPCSTARQNASTV